MGVGGSKGGISDKLEKHRKKQLSKRKPMFGKIIGNEHLEGEDTTLATQRTQLRAAPPPKEFLSREPDASSTSVKYSQGSHSDGLNTPDIPSAPSRYQGSTEYVANLNSSQDTLSRELALTSSPHYKSNEFLTGPASETTRLHFELAQLPRPFKSSMFSSNNNNNNRNSRTKLQTVASNRKESAKSQSCSHTSALTNDAFNGRNGHSSLPQLRGVSTDSATSDLSSSHPYGHPKLRRPRRLSSTLHQQPSPLCSQSSQFSYSLPSQSSLESPFTPGAHRTLDPEKPELTIAERIRLLLNTSPHLCRSLTPQELTASSAPMDASSDIEKGYESSPADGVQLEAAEIRSVGSPTRSRNSSVGFCAQSAFAVPTSPTSTTPRCDSISELGEQADRTSPVQRPAQSLLPANSPDAPQLAAIRPKLSLTRRCSEATLPLSFSSKQHKPLKRTRKPRSNTSNSSLEAPKGVAFSSSLETSSPDTSRCSDRNESFSPTRKLFLTSNAASKSRHSMYFLSSSPDFNQAPTQPRPHHANGFLNNPSYSKDRQVIESESILNSNFTRPHGNTFLSSACMHSLPEREELPSATAEESFFGEESKFNNFHTPEYTSSTNQDSNLDYSLNNALDSQDYADASSVEDMTASGDFSDSGCHANQVGTKHFSKQSVNKVCLDLNQVKYVGLNLVGGADSPFGNLPVLVKEVMPNGAGERCGIKRGDEIIGINNVSLDDKPLQFAVERLRQCSSRDQEIILWVIPQTDSC